MCVTVENCGRAKSVDRFFKTARTEEGIDFRIFPLQRRSNWGIMQDHYPAFSLQLDQRLLETNNVANLFLYAFLDQRLAPRIQHPAAKAAAEAADPRESNTGDFDGFPVKHGYAGLIENVCDCFRMSGFVIIISDDTDTRDSHRAANISGEFFRFLGKSVLSEVAAEQ